VEPISDNSSIPRDVNYRISRYFILSFGNKEEKIKSGGI
jgi:hypothetical protein